MRYEVIISPRPIRIMVESLSGPDVAEELARQRFREVVKELDNIHDADHSTAVVNPLGPTMHLAEEPLTCRCDRSFGLTMSYTFCENRASYMAKSRGDPDKSFPACEEHVQRWYKEDGSGHLSWVEKL